MKAIAKLIAYLIVNFVIAQPAVVSEDILIWNDSIQLPGTLKSNLEKIPQPLVIFIQGSGNPNRNGNQPSFNVHADYINQLGDALAAQDIAFFSYDKRNVTKANFKSISEHYIFSDIVSDAKAVINNFKDDNRFSSITIVGHSQGSLVGMLANEDQVDKYVSLAGLSETADDAFVRQISNQNEQLGEIARQHANELKSTGDIKEMNILLVSLFGKANHEFLIDYFKYDPSEEIKKINIPILIINGTKDIQVPVDDAKALHASNPNSKLVLIDNMNHILKTIETEASDLSSYYTPDYPISEELVTLLTEFVKE